jgi:hypothetical protein
VKETPASGGRASQCERTRPAGSDPSEDSKENRFLNFKDFWNLAGLCEFLQGD